MTPETRDANLRRPVAAATLLLGACLCTFCDRTPSTSQMDEWVASGRSERVGATAYRVIPQNTPYDGWVARAAARGVPVFEGVQIQDVRTERLRPWADVGVDGLYVRMADYQIIDAWILEIPPRRSAKVQRHVFEAGMYFFGGPGHVVLQQEGGPPQDVPFDYRTLFSIPLNTRYQIFNDGDQPVRVIAVTSFPFVMNAMDNERFAFENPFVFRERYDGQEDFWRTQAHPRDNLTVANWIEDAVTFPLDAYDFRGADTTNTHWTMAGNSMIELHVSEMPGGVYKRAHRHTSDAFILLFSGDGSSLTWPEGADDKRVRVDWREGSMFVPPTYWYHQHLNPGAEPARYLAINAPNLVTNLGLRFDDQLDRDRDLPEIEREFAAEVAKRAAGRTAR